ncbi:MAG: cupin domain-containing protein [Pseudomonadales bacterium]
MDIRADLSEFVYVTPADWQWSDSPQPGVARVMLDRVGDEVAVATSFVRYAENSVFPEHNHALGEEYIVIEGEFADENGRFPVGSYVRNPPGTKHSPFSQPGCVIWVKLRQFDTADLAQFDVNLNTEIPAAGWSERELHRHDREVVREFVAAAGEEISFAAVPQVQEMLILAGDVAVVVGRASTVTLPERSWLRVPPDQEVVLTANAPTRLFTKTRPVYR